LDRWRNSLAKWVEEHIFKPFAQMQGFVDEEKTKRMGKTHWMFPKIKWNDMNLRDKTNRLQLLLQIHDKQIVSTQTLCEEFNLN